MVGVTVVERQKKETGFPQGESLKVSDNSKSASKLIIIIKGKFNNNV